MQINSFGWWAIILLNLFTYFIYRFGIISRGNSKALIEFAGGMLLLVSFILMFFLFGIKSVVFLIVIFWFVVTPTVKIFMGKMEKKLYGHYLKTEKRLAQKYNMSIEELRKYKDKSEEGIVKEILPGLTGRDKTKRLYNKQPYLFSNETIANPNLPDVIKREFIKRAKK